MTGFESQICWVTSAADGATIFQCVLSIDAGPSSNRTFRRMQGGNFTSPTTYTLINNVAAVFPLRIF